MREKTTANQQSETVEKLQQKRIWQLEAELNTLKVQNNRLMHILAKLNQINRDREHVYGLIQQLVNNQ